MVSVSPQLFYVLFADNSNIFRSGREIDLVISEMNEALGEWLNTNKLTLNIKKTHFMIFSSPKSNIQPTSDIIINGQSIDRVESTRFLGVLVDSKLDFKQHISHIRKKAAKGIYVLSRARRYFDEITMKELYYAFIHPYFHYCHEVWGSTRDTYLDPLIKLQKRAIRIVAGVPRRHHTFELFLSYNIIPFKKLYKYSVYLFLYKLINNLLPSAIQSTFVFNNQIHQHHTRHADRLHAQTFSSAPRKRALRYQSAFLHAKNATVDYSITFVTFKFCVKTMLFNSTD